MVRLMVTTMMLATCIHAVAEEPTDSKSKLHPRVKMETSVGDIVLELDAEKAPRTVLNFIQYVEDKFYDQTCFHRVIKTFMIQGGGFTAEIDKKSDGLRAGIKNEWQNGLKNARGTIAMARLGGAPNSATSQFFINVVDNGRLDQPQGDGAAYCVFGKVVKGMDTADKIRDVPVAVNPKYNTQAATVPVETIVVKTVRLIGEFDRQAVQKILAAEEAAVAAAGAKKRKEIKGKILETVARLEKETGKKAVEGPEGLYYIVLKEGDPKGEKPEFYRQVEVHYTGWLADGTKFDSSYDRGKPTIFRLSSVISGWTQGVGLMTPGAKHKLIIRPGLAYENLGRPPTIPPYAVLVFDIELLRIIPKDK